MILYWSTLGVVVAVVVVLVVYLVAIARALNAARRNVAALADGLETVAGHTEPLGDKVETIAAALEAARQGFDEVDHHLGRAGEAFAPARTRES